MIAGKLAEEIACYWTSGCAAIFILSYSIMARWFRSIEGVLLMTLAVAFCAASYIGVVVARGPGTAHDHLRLYRAGLTFGVGIIFLAYSYIILKNQYKNRNRRRAAK